MKNLSILAMAVLFSSNIYAFEFDMAEITCKDIESEKTASMVLFWMDGYVSAKEDDTNFTEEWVDELSSYIKEGCEENPKQSILGIVQDKYLNAE